MCSPCGIFFGFVASKVGPNITWALVAVVAAELLTSLFCLSLTALRDPGFYPRDDANRPEAKAYVLQHMPPLLLVATLYAHMKRISSINCMLDIRTCLSRHWQIFHFVCHEASGSLLL